MMRNFLLFGLLLTISALPTETKSVSKQINRLLGGEVSRQNTEDEGLFVSRGLRNHFPQRHENATKRFGTLSDDSARIGTVVEMQEKMRSISDLNSLLHEQQSNDEYKNRFFSLPEPPQPNLPASSFEGKIQIHALHSAEKISTPLAAFRTHDSSDIELMPQREFYPDKMIHKSFGHVIEKTVAGEERLIPSTDLYVKASDLVNNMQNDEDTHHVITDNHPVYNKSFTAFSKPEYEGEEETMDKNENNEGEQDAECDQPQKKDCIGNAD